MMSVESFAERVERILLHPLATREEVQRLCEEARLNAFYGVGVPSSWVEEAYELIDSSSLKISCLIGFPFGSADADVKRFETEVAVDNGAHEIELMPNYGFIKSGDYPRLLRELRDVVEAADERPVSVSLEVGSLTASELQETAAVVLDSGAQFIGSSGLMGKTPGLDAIANLRKLVGPRFGVKAGGLRDLAAAQALIDAGANRLALLNQKSLFVPASN